MTMKIEFNGIDELIKELETIGQDVEKIKKEALIAGAELLKERARDAVYSYGLRKRSGKAPEYIDRTNPKNDEIFVGNTKDGFYLYFHEIGYWHVKGKRFIPPKPFMSVTYQRSVNAILNEYKKVFQRGLKMQ